tara:strand:- start:3092 stop:4153 length:1062 start_codon:yes stop_codon:yes gene_type:complete
MSNKYIMECNHTQALETVLHGSKVFPLVAELNKHFGLKVINCVMVDDLGDQARNGGGVEGFVMANDYGIPKCIAFIRDVRKLTYVKDKEVWKDVYVFKHSQRFKYGGTWNEKDLCTSVKLPQLIRAIKGYGRKLDDFPAYNGENDCSEGKYNLDIRYEYLSDEFKLEGQGMWNLKRKSDEATTEQLQKHIPSLIDSYINNVTPSAEVDAKIRDDYNQALSYAGKVEELKDIITEGLNSGFTAIGIDNAEGYVVGSIETLIGAKPELKYKNFKRYTELEDYSKYQDILPMLTMHKVRKQEEKDLELYKDYFVIQGGYGKNCRLDDFTGIFMHTNDIFDSSLEMTWLLLPNVESV